MNRKGFFATVAAAFGVGVGTSVARASGEAAAQPTCGCGHADRPPDWVGVSEGAFLHLRDRLDDIDESIGFLSRVLQDHSLDISNLATQVNLLAERVGEINVAVDDRDDVDQNASATNRTQIVASGGNVVSPGQSIGQCQNGG